jgi:hypothetical protein
VKMSRLFKNGKHPKDVLLQQRSQEAAGKSEKLLKASQIARVNLQQEYEHTELERRGR